MSSIQQIEFKAIDGITLRGQIYPAEGPGPAIVLSPGSNCVIDMLGLPDVAKAFQHASITALIYDPRSTGLSDGMPRNGIDPLKQVEDMSNALTFMSGCPTVIPDQMGIWGFSLGGAVALSVASLDKRAKMVIAICPVSEYQYSPEKLPKVLAKCIKDRESQIKGNEPYYIPMINEAGENPAGFNFGANKTEEAKIFQAVQKAGMEGVASHHVNRTTIQSYYRLVVWQPSHLWVHLDPTPVLFVVPQLDCLCPPSVQRRYFDALSGPKHWHLEKGRGHRDITQRDHLPDLMRVKIDFMRNALSGRVGE
ncbi:hypothetical protein BOTCAL_0095g00040 [Botryotinia calthae]|uniref:Serine aminopeptidase S33 domain-containing protein n=1 Tax=Botryotinia calthae TaxID=38488 RepID=A0A4Y8D950_9HELO|nr:hypothetical protein BOTCAL_0095g00040 [Botryotinia calthae]